MADLHGFDANNVEPHTGFDAIPAGKYLAIIVNSEWKTTKAGDGQYLEFEFDVIEGEFKGRKQWARLNLKNKSSAAVRIAEAELSAICHAVGVMKPNDSLELHTLPLTITVGCRKREDTGDIANEIKKFEKKGAEAGEPQQAAAAVESAPPWARA